MGQPHTGARAPSTCGVLVLCFTVGAHTHAACCVCAVRAYGEVGSASLVIRQEFQLCGFTLECRVSHRCDEKWARPRLAVGGWLVCDDEPAANRVPPPPNDITANERRLCARF